MLMFVGFILSSVVLIQCLLVNRSGALKRPEFYLFASMYLYGNSGYWGHVLLGIPASFLEPSYSESTYTTSYILTLLALTGIYVGGALYRPLGRCIRPHQPSDAIAAAASVFASIAVMFAIYFYTAAGAYSGASHGDVLAQKWIPYMIVLIPSFALVCMYERSSILSASILTIFSIVTLAAGSRRHVLLLLIVFFAAKAFVGRSLPVRLVVSLTALFLMLAVTVGMFRGNYTVEVVLVDPQLLATRLQYVWTEFVRPYSSLLYFLNQGDQIDYLFGKSIWDSIKLIPPGFLQPYEGPSRLGTEFSRSLSEITTMDRPIGHGFFAVTEVFINFGRTGVLAVFLLIAFCVRIVTVSMNAGVTKFIVPVLCPLMYNVPREGFQPLGYYLFWGVAVGFTVLCCASLLEKSGNVSSRLG